MEKLNLLQSNGVYYIEKSGMKLALSYMQPFSMYANDYISIQLNSKPIIKSEKKGVDRILDSLEDMTGMKLNLPPNMSEMVKSMFADKNALKDMMGKFGVDSSKLDNMEFDLNDDSAFDSIMEAYNKRAGLKFNAILGADVLNKFMILFEFKDNSISLFSDKMEVGEIIGTTYHISNINKEGYIASSLSFLEINDINIKSVFDITGKYMYLSDTVYNEVMMKQTQMPETKIDNDYLSHLGSINDTFFKLNAKSQYLNKDVWLGKLPDLGNALADGLKELKGSLDAYLPLSFFEDGVLVDGINKKFGYLKK